MLSYCLNADAATLSIVPKLLADACGVGAGADVSDGIASSLQAMTGDIDDAQLRHGKMVTERW